MLSDDELARLTTGDQIREEISARRQLLGQMVGSLYPAILRDEIGQLYRRLDQIKVDGFLAREGGDS